MILMDGSSFYLNLPFGGIPELSSAQERIRCQWKAGDVKRSISIWGKKKWVDWEKSEYFENVEGNRLDSQEYLCQLSSQDGQPILTLISTELLFDTMLHKLY